jgi:hypothetical protein
MASIYKIISVDVPAEFAWDAIVDIGALHTRLVRGFVANTTLEDDVRTVIFVNGMSVKERIISIDNTLRRLAYTAVGGRASHHNAYVQVTPSTAQSCHIAWVTDLLPNEMAGPIGQMVDAGAAAIKQTLESAFGH